MGSFDGAELRELIGINIQPLLESTLEKDQIGLHRDDGLIIFRNINNQQTDKIRKKIISIFKSIDFKIEIATNLKEVNFLEVTFILERTTYRSYKNQMITQHTSKSHQIIHHNSLNTSLKPLVKGYPEFLQVLKHLKNQNQITKKH